MFKRYTLILCLLMAFRAPASAATLSMLAVAVNGTPITPTDVAGVSPGDVVLVEVRLSGWGEVLPEGRLRIFDTTINGAEGALSGPMGSVLPIGWNAPVIMDPCSDGCPAEYPLCQSVCANSGCTGSGHNPAQSLSINCQDPNHAFAGLDAICDVGTGQICSLSIKHFGVAINEGALDPGNGHQALLGSVTLKVSEDACGSFIFRFEPPPTTFITGADNKQVEVTRAPLIISTALNAEDCNENLIPDQCDVTAGASSDLNTNLSPDECDLDLDGDGDIDLHDAALMIKCFGIATGACSQANFYNSIRVDKLDWSAMADLLGSEIGGPPPE